MLSTSNDLIPQAVAMRTSALNQWLNTLRARSVPKPRRTVLGVNPFEDRTVPTVLSGNVFQDLNGNGLTTLRTVINSSAYTPTVTSAPCIAFGAPGIALRLNGFSITGKGDAVTVMSDLVDDESFSHGARR